jgi:hypothetical protein
MNGEKKRWMVYVLLASLLIPFVYAEYEDNIHEAIFLVRPDNTYITETSIPTYLSSEDLTFFACVEAEDTPVRLSVLCKDDNNFIDVAAYRWGPENCYIGSVDLNDLPCYNAVLAADYVRDDENHRLIKDIQINKITGALQRVLSLQFEDGGWSSALDTAYVLFSLKPFATVFDEPVDKALLYIKNTRDDRQKCWPEDQCQVSTTAMIAYLLTQADYDDSLRVIQDSTVYLEQSMNYIASGETWTVSIEDFFVNLNNSVNTSCVYAYDADNTTVVMPRWGREINYTETPSYFSVINVVCTENVNVDIVSSERGRILHYEGDNLTYTIPGACWTFNNENVTCDLRTTALAIGAPIDDDRKSAATDYLASQLTTSVLGSQFSDGDIMNLAAFSVSAGTELDTAQREDLFKYLLYRQTNTGAWNATTTYYNYTYYEPQDVELTNFSHVIADNYTKSIIYTGYAVQALLEEGYDHSDEVIKDAERWVSLNELTVMQELSEEESADAEIVASYELNVTDIQDDPKRNAMALYVLQQHTRPFIKSNPRVLLFDKQSMTVELVNPTEFTLQDLTYQFSSDIAPYVTVDPKDYLAPYSFRKITLTQTNQRAANAFGYMRIMSGSEEYAKIPIIVSSYPSLSIDIPTQLVVFGSSTVAALNVTKSAHNYSCTLQWETAGISTISSFNLESDGLFNLPIQFTQPATEEKDYAGVLSCTAQTSTFTFPFTMRVNRFITRPLAVGPAMVFLNATDTSGLFSLKNLLDESIEVTIGLRDPNSYLDFSEYIVDLYPGEERNITVSVIPPPGENLSIVNAISIKTFNLEERIPIEVEYIVPIEETTPVWIIVGSIVFAIGVLTAVAYFGYSNRVKILEWYNKKYRKEISTKKTQAAIEDVQKREMTIAIKNMMQIFKMEGVSEKEISVRLKEQGFTEQEIQDAVRMKDDANPATAPKK